jgi:predicted methyltransferase
VEWPVERRSRASHAAEETGRADANPRDTKDYPRGAWTLPPAFALGAEDREKYSAIGEGDNLVLKFAKPGR